MRIICEEKAIWICATNPDALALMDYFNNLEDGKARNKFLSKVLELMIENKV